MLSYIIVAAIFLSLGNVITYYYMKQDNSRLIESHHEEIQSERSKWFSMGWDDAIKSEKREAYYDLIKRGVITPDEF